MNDHAPLLSVRDLHKSYPSAGGDLVVLNSVNLSLSRGVAMALMGPSGCGKSTLLNIIGALDTPTSGAVSVDGQDPFSLDRRALARFRNHKIGYVFQDHHLLPQCTALENVLAPTLAFRDNPDRSDRARELLQRVGLAARMDHRPAEMSGGERQRVALARALINEPRLLLADEPTGSLDRRAGDQIAELLRELTAADGVAMIVVTHSAMLAGAFAKCYELRDGALTTSGAAA
ncbi:MAG: ABC transporter ATP-binding protein [Phycisphaerales bacterium]|nr:ABC transporter ATP-binding protein [Phycisphaerales bacterium]